MENMSDDDGDGENHLITMVLLQVILIALNAVFACAEIAIISMNDIKLERMAAEGDRRALRLARLTGQPAKFLATIQVAITLSGFLGSAFAAENFSDSIVDWAMEVGIGIPKATLDTIAVVGITIVLSYFTLVFGELVPKRVAMRKAEPLALGMSALISGIAKLFAPVVWLLTKSTNAMLYLLGINPEEEDEVAGEEEIRMMVDVGSEKGVIDDEEKQLIQNVFEFDDLTAGEIATHRTEIDFLWMDETLAEWKDRIHKTRHTLYPVCGESMDDLLGILNAKDFFAMEEKGREEMLEKAVKPAYYVPETVKADLLFRNMKYTHNKLAVISDEYGGLCGIVTINDLVEQLVGELEEEETLIEQVGENLWNINGRAQLEHVSEALGVLVQSDGHDTFNGLVFSALGYVPPDGTDIELETELLSIHIVQMNEHQIKKAVVSLKK